MVNIGVLTNLLQKKSYRVVPKNIITQEASDKIKAWCEKWGFFWDGETICDIDMLSVTCQYEDVSVHEILPLISYMKRKPDLPFYMRERLCITNSMAKGVSLFTMIRIQRSFAMDLGN